MTIVPPNAATEVTKYYYFGGQRVAMRKNGVLTYLHADHLGSTVLETNITGTVTTDEKYLAYGKQRDSGKVTTDHRFTRHKEDASGLQYFNSRFYDPVIGMFVSPDTIVPDAGLVSDYNRYMYTRGNPMIYNDPTGHCVFTPIDAIVCVVVGVALIISSDTSNHHEPSQEEINSSGLGGGLILGGMGGLLFTEARAGGMACAASEKCQDTVSKGAEVSQEVVENLPCVNSFSSDTVVLTDDGLEPIVMLTIGDQVYAYNEATGQTGLYTVTATMAHLDPVIVTLVIDGETIHTTPAHPFYANGDWVDAGKLQVGDAIRKEDGTVGDVESINVAHHTQVMYNLTVAQAHTFFVGSGQWLVHNVDCGDLVNYRPSNSPFVNHHGILDAWAKNNVPGYVSRAADNPTVALTSAQHDAANQVMWDWFSSKGGAQNINWSQISAREIYDLSERMFDAANVSREARDAYYSALNMYYYLGKWEKK